MPPLYVCITNLRRLAILKSTESLDVYVKYKYLFCEVMIDAGENKIFTKTIGAILLFCVTAKWRQVAYKLAPITRYYISDLFERQATPLQRQQGLDLADCLVECDYKEFLEGKK